MINLDKLFNLKPGDVITYKDNNGLDRKVTFVKNVGLVKAIRGEGEALQQQFEDEKGNIVHIPVNAWKFLGGNNEKE